MPELEIGIVDGGELNFWGRVKKWGRVKNICEEFNFTLNGEY